MTTLKPKGASGPVEVWLTQRNIEITCMIVFEDESADNPSVESLSMRGAQREMTSYLLAHGYEPAGRWETETGEEGGGTETVRRFRPARQPQAARP
jgi:hypothetical protein